MHAIAVLAVFCFLIAGSVFVIVFAGKRWKEKPRLKNVVTNTTLTIFAFSSVLLAAEVYFFFNIESDGFGFTLANARWTHLYWHPINSLGFRDDERSGQDIEGKRLILALGDSFTAGAGIRDYQDRFSNRLEAKLGEGWAVANVAQCGWDTPDEFAALKAYPDKPEIVILQYLINDIRHAAQKYGVDPAMRPPLPPAPMQFLLERSFLFNTIYWRLHRRFRHQFSQDSFWDRLQACYEDEEIWNDHSKALDEILEYLSENGSHIIVVLFPFLPKVEISTSAVEKVARHFEARGVDVINVEHVVAGRSPETLVCNPFDGHPNESLHEEVATLIRAHLEAKGLLAPTS